MRTSPAKILADLVRGADDKDIPKVELPPVSWTHLGFRHQS